MSSPSDLVREARRDRYSPCYECGAFVFFCGSPKSPTRKNCQEYQEWKKDKEEQKKKAKEGSESQPLLNATNGYYEWTSEGYRWVSYSGATGT